MKRRDFAQEGVRLAVSDTHSCASADTADSKRRGFERFGGRERRGADHEVWKHAHFRARVERRSARGAFGI